MGFLDLYDGTTKVDVGNDFYIEVKNFLSNADYTEANKVLLKDQRVGASGVSASLDTAGYQLAVMRKAIVGWNLTDKENKPIDPNDATIAMLPQVVFNKVFQVVQSSEEEKSPAEQAQFPVAR